ncbi:MAG TPA: hypothetical protein VNB06_15665 [Thermoanaerobaculia bacterium]|nr:hypothetical protein [Thermoanaerobaculia bacterium]
MSPSITLGTKDQPFLSRELLLGTSAFGITITGPEDSEALAALLTNGPFPAGDLSLGELALSLEGGSAIRLSGGQGQGSVSFAADARAGVAVSSDAATLVDTLALGAPWGATWAPASNPQSRFVLATWAYGLEAATQLQARPVELGGGLGVSFAGAAHLGGTFAVLRRIAADAPSRHALAGTFGAWRLPKRLGHDARSPRATDLPPHTWLVTEVDGGLDLELGVTAGHELSWVRETELGELIGDLSLRIQLGLEARLRASLAGRYAVVLARESDAEILRLRLHKLRKRGWGFALDFAASVEPSTGELLPESFEGFIAGALGLDPAQALEDLEGVRKWLDPENLPKKLASLGSEYLLELFEEVTGVDPIASFDQARDTVVELLDRWDALDQRVAAELWGLVGQGVAADIARVRALADRLAGLGDEDTLREELRALLGRADLPDTPEGRWLVAVAEGRLASLLGERLGEVAGIAGQVRDLLDPARLLAPFQRLQKWIGDRLRLDRVREAANEADPAEALDKWLASRLQRFVGPDTPVGDALGDLADAIDKLLAQSGAFWEKTRNALNRSYELSLSASYNRLDTKDALLDVEFDFALGSAQELGDLLSKTLGGDFTPLLTTSTPGVRLLQAFLSHETLRESRVEVNLPWFQKQSAWRNLATATLAVEDDGQGRLLLYELEAQDEIRSSARARFQRVSSLALTARLPRRALRDVRVHDEPSASASAGASYALRELWQNAQRRDLEDRLELWAKAYFPDTFSGVGDGSISDAFEDWLDELDRALDTSPAHGGAGNFGPAFLASLDVALDSKVVEVWFQSGLSTGDHQAMSRALQAKLKDLVFLAHFADLAKASGNVTDDAVLLYTALPPLTAFKVVNGQIRVSGAGVYWDYLQADRRGPLVRSSATHNRLRARLTELHVRLLRHGHTKKAKNYDPSLETNLDRVRGRLGNASARKLFESLAGSESQLVHATRDAQRALAKFEEASTKDPQKALAALRKLGGELAQTFHKDLGNVLGSHLRPLGPLLFVEGALALEASRRQREVRPDALMRVAVAKSADAIDPAKFLAGEWPEREQLLIQQLVSE